MGKIRTDLGVSTIAARGLVDGALVTLGRSVKPDTVEEKATRMGVKHQSDGARRTMYVGASGEAHPKSRSCSRATSFDQTLFLLRTGGCR